MGVAVWQASPAPHPQVKPIPVFKPRLEVDVSSVGPPAPKGRTLNLSEQTGGCRGAAPAGVETRPRAAGGSTEGSCPPVWAAGLQERGSADLVSTNSIKRKVLWSRFLREPPSTW